MLDGGELRPYPLRRVVLSLELLRPGWTPTQLEERREFTVRAGPTPSRWWVW